MPSRSTNTGLIMTISSPGLRPTDTSTTKTRSGTPICVAASPTPGAAYMVSIMSSIEPVHVVVDRRDVGGGLMERALAVAQDRSDHGT